MSLEQTRCEICQAKIAVYLRLPDGSALGVVHHKDGTHEVVVIRGTK